MSYTTVLGNKPSPVAIHQNNAAAIIENTLFSFLFIHLKMMLQNRPISDIGVQTLQWIA